MTLPISFEQQNCVYTHPDCYDLPVERRDTMLGEEKTIEVISAWKLSPEEWETVKQTGVVYLRVIGGQPPVSITGHYPAAQ